MNDLEILYQTYLVTFATATALRRSGNRTRYSDLVHDVEQRSGAQRIASELALSDATEVDNQLRTRTEVVSAIVERTANAFHCAPGSVYAALDRRHT